MVEYDAIVIGGGYSGLSYGALLSKFGKKVLLVERDGWLGGRAAARTASQWGWHRSSELIAYGPHIVPAKAYAEKMLDILGIKDRLSLRWTNIPYLFRDGKVVEVPTKLTNIISVFRLFPALGHVPIREKIGFLSLFRHVNSLSIPDIIERYEHVPTYELCEKFKMTSPASKELVGLITGSAVQSLDLTDCPALDFMVMVKLMINGCKKAGTIMYESGKGYDRIFSELGRMITRGGGRIVKNIRIDRLVTDRNAVRGVYMGGKKSLADHVVFTGVPRDLRRLLDKSRLNSDFLGPCIALGPTSTVDMILVSKRNIHDSHSKWLYPLMMAQDPARRFGYVIIEEGVGLGGRYLYHVCTISKEKIGIREINRIKHEIEENFGFSFERDVLWSTVKTLDVYGTKRSIKVPFSSRPGPQTPHPGLFVIGDSYKALTTGTDGCAYSAMDLAGRMLDKDFGLDEFCK